MNKYTNTHSPIFGKNAKSTQKFSKMIGVAAFTASFLATSQSAVAAEAEQQPALLVIGASGESGRLPLNDNMEGPFYGLAINFGSYLSLGAALIRTPELPGFVINEAQAGASTFDRLGCNPGPSCGPGSWLGYNKQFDKALARVTVRDPENPANVLYYNADYMVIGMANDCLHSDAFGIPQTETQPCTFGELNAYIDRLIAVGQRALDLGITPIYTVYPPSSAENLSLGAEVYGFEWMLDEVGYNELRDLHRTRLNAELPDALVLDAWRDFTPIPGDTHADSKSSMKAARRIAQAIKKHREDN